MKIILPNTKEEFVEDLYFGILSNLSNIALCETSDGKFNEDLAVKLAKKAFKKALNEAIADAYEIEKYREMIKKKQGAA